MTGVFLKPTYKMAALKERKGAGVVELGGLRWLDS